MDGKEFLLEKLIIIMEIKELIYDLGDFSYVMKKMCEGFFIYYSEFVKDIIFILVVVDEGKWKII